MTACVNRLFHICRQHLAGSREAQTQSQRGEKSNNMTDMIHCTLMAHQTTVCMCVCVYVCALWMSNVVFVCISVHWVGIDACVYVCVCLYKTPLCCLLINAVAVCSSSELGVYLLSPSSLQSRLKGDSCREGKMF